MGVFDGGTIAMGPCCGAAPRGDTEIGGLIGINNGEACGGLWDCGVTGDKDGHPPDAWGAWRGLKGGGMEKDSVGYGLTIPGGWPKGGPTEEIPRNWGGGCWMFGVDGRGPGKGGGFLGMVFTRRLTCIWRKAERSNSWLERIVR
jgi:hypothetical protein